VAGRLETRLGRPENGLTRFEDVLARFTVAGVRIRTAVELVVAGAGRDLVVAGTSLELVVTARSSDGEAGIEGDVVPADHVVAAIPDDAIVPGGGGAVVADGVVTDDELTNFRRVRDVAPIENVKACKNRLSE
jgi:hypothetical protein